MTMLKITAGPYEFRARLESDSAPATCAAFEELRPFRQKVIHTRWSGESTWIPLGDFDLGIDYENPTSHPAPGEILAYPGGGLSETSRGPRNEPGRTLDRLDDLALRESCPT